LKRVFLFGTFKARGIVIKEIFSGESDKTVTMLLKGHGKLSAHSRGARKPNSKYLAGTQIFAYSDFVLFTKNNFYSITQIDLIESFFNLRCGYDRLCASNYAAEVAGAVVLYGMQADNILFLLLKTLQSLNNCQTDIKLILSAFNIKLIQLLGYAPDLSCCTNCGGPVSGSYLMASEGLLCSNCRALPHIEISTACFNTINYILSAGIKSIFNFGLAPGYISEVFNLSEIFIKSHIDVNIMSRKLFAF
jgi:DNA repair protein RecO (recombination protein O)